jgi:3-methyladenine DNA glycosylase AlkD
LTSKATARATAFVAARLPAASDLGTALADLIEDPESFVQATIAGLEALADPVYQAEQERVAPGSGVTLGVRWPLLYALERALRPGLRESSSSSVLWLAQRLSGAAAREVRLLALPCLARVLPDDPERAWQLLRRIAHTAPDWISVDTLAGVYARGMLAEPFRWAELEQLVYSPRRMERRLVGSTLATLPHAMPRTGYGGLDTPAALRLIEALLGDADDQVQKALSWALREWSRVDQPAVAELLLREARLAQRTLDGNRAWVLRDALTRQPPAVRLDVRELTAGLRRRTGAASTSRSAEVSAAFGLAALSSRAVAQQGDRFGGRGA